MTRWALPCLLVLLAGPALAAIGTTEETGVETASPAESRSLLGEGFPVEVRVSFPAALLHWLDSLVRLDGPGMTAGPTATAHREEYNDLFGPPGKREVELLQRYREARSANPQSTDAFLPAPDIESALAAAATMLDERDLASIEVAVLQLAPRYRRIWAGGRVSTRFVERIRDDPMREELAKFLAGVARFHGVSPAREPRLQLLPVPVRSGVGTYARAHGRHLLLEIRRSDELREQVGPLVRESARFLFDTIAEDRRAGLRDAARTRDDAGERIWRLLRDALSVAIAQGVAAERFDERWSAAPSWCDDPEIDRYAKALFPLVKRTLASRGRLDRKFVAEAARLVPAAP